MDAKDKFEALMRQSEFFASRHDERRKYEWKVALGFWGALLAATQIGKITLPGGLAFLILVTYSFVWLRGLWIANEKDKRASFSLWEKAQEIVSKGNHTVSPIINPKDSITYKNGEYWYGFIISWPVWFHILATSILVYILYAGINLSSDAKPQKVEVKETINTVIPVKLENK